MNAILKKSLNLQISLLETSRCLVAAVRTFEAKLLAEEITSSPLRLRILDFCGFVTLLGKVTRYAIDLMTSEWATAYVPKPDLVWEDGCSHGYLLSLKYGLLCQHWMIKTVTEGFPLQLFLVHPRWWLSGSPVELGDGLWGTMMQ